MEDKKKEILKCGKLLFSKQGFKETNISQITKMAGMATGTFYNYYPSKDKLFIEIYIEENSKLKKSILDSLNLEDEPIKVMEKMMSLNYEGMITNSILKEWYNKDVFNKIQQSFNNENGISKVDFVYDSFIEVIEYWQENGRMRKDINSKMIMAIFSSIINVDLHKDEIGIEYFPEVLEHISEFVMKGLTE